MAFSAAIDPHSFGSALISTTRAGDIKAEEDIFAPLLGVWDVDTRDLQPDGSAVAGRGEWLFSRILEGRAFQDVWIMPARVPQGARPNHLYNRYGTTVRMMDPQTRRWQIAWFNPISGAFDVLHATVVDGQVIQEGRRPDGQRIRWVFDEITAQTFHWYGDSLQPDGGWRREVDFTGRRRSNVTP